MTAFGDGRVAFLGNGQLLSASGPLRLQPALPPLGNLVRPPAGSPFGTLAEADNAVFVVDLVAYLAGRPMLSPAERARLAWDAKLLDLSAALGPGPIQLGRPRSPEQADFAGAHSLFRAAERGQRCDLGPGCVPFSLDAAAHAELERAAELTDRALAALDAAEQALDRQDYPAVERSQREALDLAHDALATAGRVRDRYGGLRSAPDQQVLLDLVPPALLLLVIATGFLLTVAPPRTRRWRDDVARPEAPADAARTLDRADRRCGR